MQWLPHRAAQLRSDGLLTAETLAAADLAQMEINHLMQRGYPLGPFTKPTELGMPLAVLCKRGKGSGRHPIKDTPSARAAIERAASSVASGCPLRSAISK
jgi:hypothetical protein